MVAGFAGASVLPLGGILATATPDCGCLRLWAQALNHVGSGGRRRARRGRLSLLARVRRDRAQRGVKAMSDEEIEQAIEAIEAIQTMLAARAGEAAKVIEGSADAPTAVLFDPTGEVGHAYGARTTPHMYVIDGEGALVYQGGIDDKPTA